MKIIPFEGRAGQMKNQIIKHILYRIGAIYLALLIAAAVVDELFGIVSSVNMPISSDWMIKAGILGFIVLVANLLKESVE